MKKCIILDLDSTIFDTHGTRRAYQDVHPMLRALMGEHTFTLLTAGNQSAQWQKIKECDVVDYMAAVMIVPDPAGKEHAIASLVAVYRFEPKDVIVVGDRADIEIAYANRIGCASVWLRRGKHTLKVPLDAGQEPTHTISTLLELIPIVCG
jgi:FMN phosphatase YigB (HAD superfamily)